MHVGPSSVPGGRFRSLLGVGEMARGNGGAEGAPCVRLEEREDWLKGYARKGFLRLLQDSVVACTRDSLWPV